MRLYVVCGLGVDDEVTCADGFAGDANVAAGGMLYLHYVLAETVEYGYAMYVARAIVDKPAAVFAMQKARLSL